MYIIAGLGNPGLRYKNTRHNLGFLFLEYISNRLDDSTSFQKEGSFFYKPVNCFNKEIILLKPDTYMNLSGNAIAESMSFFHVSTSDLIVCYDDFALSAGSIRIREKGSDGGHNGIANIIETIGLEFVRIRFGISTEELKNINTVDYVLGHFSELEFDLHIDAFEKGYDALNYVIAENSVTAAMQNFNKKNAGGMFSEH